MPVYDQSYKHWEGSFRPHSFRWWVVTKYGIKTALKKKAVKLLYGLALVPFIGGAVYIYGVTHVGKVTGFVNQISGQAHMQGFAGEKYYAVVEGDRGAFLQKLREEGFQHVDAGERTGIIAPEGKNSKSILAIAKGTGVRIRRLVPPGMEARFYSDFLKWQSGFLFFLLLLVVGAGLIAKDVKFNALQIYLAKPITGIEYILGKLGILFFFLIMVTLVPGLFLFLFQAILIGDSLYVRHYWWVPGAICAYSLLAVLSGSLLILAFSALSRNVRSASSAGAAVLWFSTMVAGFLQHATRNENYSLLSFRHNWIRVGEKIFGLEVRGDVWWGWSVLILVAVMVVSAGVLVRRVRCVEVVK